MSFRLLMASPTGEVLEHPWLSASVDVFGEPVLASEAPIPLPKHARLVALPGRQPVGFDAATGARVVVDRYQFGRLSVPVSAVGALLPPGYTRTQLPGIEGTASDPLPQWAYAAAAWSAQGPVTWAMRTDRRRHWSPSRYSTPDLKSRVALTERELGPNQVIRQLRTCALVYRCFTSQNIFYQRDEGALPVSTMCNAACVGCISEQPAGGPPASHERMNHGPTVSELAAVAERHLAHASGRTMVSFGQGCEGEPLTRWKVIAEAIELVRRQTRRGSININTNGSLSAGLAGLLAAGLDSVRISLNSARPALYEAYYQPQRYGWGDVERSIALARRHGAYVALNLLTFPGVTDLPDEVAALERLVRRYRVDQVQTRPLSIDPHQYLAVARKAGVRGRGVGIRTLIARLSAAAPWMHVGNFARARNERHERARSPMASSKRRRGSVKVREKTSAP